MLAPRRRMFGRRSGQPHGERMIVRTKDLPAAWQAGAQGREDGGDLGFRFEGFRAARKPQWKSPKVWTAMTRPGWSVGWPVRWRSHVVIVEWATWWSLPSKARSNLRVWRISRGMVSRGAGEARFACDERIMARWPACAPGVRVSSSIVLNQGAGGKRSAWRVACRPLMTFWMNSREERAQSSMTAGSFCGGRGRRIDGSIRS